MIRKGIQNFHPPLPHNSLTVPFNKNYFVDPDHLSRSLKNCPFNLVGEGFCKGEGRHLKIHLILLEYLN